MTTQNKLDVGAAEAAAVMLVLAAPVLAAPVAVGYVGYQIARLFKSRPDPEIVAEQRALNARIGIVAAKAYRAKLGLKEYT